MTTARAKRTLDAYADEFAQTFFGDKRAGQTPAGMFLETILKCTVDGELPRVSVLRRYRDTVAVKDHLPTNEEILAAVLNIVQEHLTTFSHDDYSARLIVQTPGSKIAWIEMLNPDTDSTSHPEMGNDPAC